MSIQRGTLFRKFLHTWVRDVLYHFYSDNTWVSSVMSRVKYLNQSAASGRFLMRNFPFARSAVRFRSKTPKSGIQPIQVVKPGARCHGFIHSRASTSYESSNYPLKIMFEFCKIQLFFTNPIFSLTVLIHTIIDKYNFRNC